MRGAIVRESPDSGLSGPWWRERRDRNFFRPRIPPARKGPLRCPPGERREFLFGIEPEAFRSFLPLPQLREVWQAICLKPCFSRLPGFSKTIPEFVYPNPVCGPGFGRRERRIPPGLSGDPGREHRIFRE